MKDKLGSYLTITNSSGAVVMEQSFDAWGRRRNPSNWNDYNVNTNNLLFDRGYTGHEHLDKFGLINMNGRMYDPVLGRFLSPDIVVQNPGNTQSYNRYTYCFNNPLAYIDPSGFVSIGNHSWDGVQFNTNAGAQSYADWAAAKQQMIDDYNAEQSGGGNTSTYEEWAEGKESNFSAEDVKTFNESGNNNASTEQTADALKDREGLWIDWVVDEKTYSKKYKGGKLYDPNGEEYTGKNAFFTSIRDQLNQLKGANPLINEMITTLENADDDFSITNKDKDNQNNGNYYNDEDDFMYFDPFNSVSSDGNIREPKIGLVHELTHMYDDYKGFGNDKLSVNFNGVFVTYREIKAINVENLIRGPNNQRNTYEGGIIKQPYLCYPYLSSSHYGNWTKE